MSWDARQVAMLAAMGLRVWPRESATADSPAEPELLPERPPQLQARPAALAGQERAAPAPAVIFTPTFTESTAQAAVAALPPALRQGSAQTGPPGSLHEHEHERRPDGAARQQALSLLDLAGLRLSAAECQACALGQVRGQGRVQGLPSFGHGAAQADCLVVVDADGGDHGDAPLGGEAALLLGNILRAMGLELAGAKANAFVTSPLKCRPQAGQTAGPAELKQCQPYLARQIELLQPRLILALGSLSSQALLQSTEVLGRLRGRLHAYQSIPVVVSYHPAYLLRQPADKPRAWADFCLALATLDGQARA